MAVGVCEECGEETTVRNYAGALVCQACALDMAGAPVEAVALATMGDRLIIARVGD